MSHYSQTASSQTPEAVSEAVPWLGLNWTTILWLLFIHVGAVFSLFYINTPNLIAFAVMYAISGLGITLAYHRLMAHRSFAVPKWLERILVTCGALAMEGGPVKWCAHHRMHHSNPDTERDPHNSHGGFFFCHISWTFKYRPEFDSQSKLRKFSRDITSDPYYRWLDTTMGQFLPQLTAALILLAIGGVGMMLCGIFLRMTAVYHATWCVNSATHFFGYRNYEINDRSRNTWWVALITFGEGWHNNHHAFQHVVEAGHKWWEVDVTMMVIRVMKAFGLVTKMKSIKDIPVHELKAAS